MPRKGHPVLEFRGRTPDFPPNCFCFQQVADGMLGLFLLEPQRRLAAAFEIAGKNLVGCSRYFGRDTQFVRVSRRAEKCRAAKEDSPGVGNNAKSLHNAPSGGYFSKLCAERV